MSLDMSRRRSNMGTLPEKFRIDYTKRVKTRGGSDVRIYDIFYQDYINGAYYDEDSDVWYPCQWDFQGNYSHKKSALDLVNV